MDLSISLEGEMAVPLNSSYGHGHMIHRDHPAASLPHNHIISSSAPQIPSNNNGPSMTASMEDSKKNTVRYRECLKNHAAAMGGNATDGCGEFMPSGEEGSIEALTCLACNCHRNFHRKEIQGETSSSSCDCCHNNPHFDRVGRKIILSHHKSILPSEALGYPTGTAATLVPSRAAGPPHQYPMIMSYNMGSLPSESEDHEYGGGVVVARPPQLAKKRFRTKFTQEQKEKMLDFAEKVGWKIQRQGEAVVQQFCQEIGVKRRVLKVWMHNNKQSLAKKSSTTTPTTTTSTA